MSASRLQSNSLIAVTGISGYVGSHVGLAALKAGHRVRGTVRSLESAQSVKAAYIKQGIPETDLEERLDFVIVDDILSSEQWLKAFEGATGLIHLALPMDEAWRQPNIGVESIFSVFLAATHVESIKRVVLTSSATAIVTPPFYKDKVLTDEDWNNEIVEKVEQATEADKQGVSWGYWTYTYGKTMAEKAAWGFIDKVKPQFDLVTVLPYANFGPVMHGEPRTTARYIAAVLRNDPSPTRTMPPQWFIDVRDDARLHVLALTTPSLSGKRILAFAEPFGWCRVLGTLRECFPGVQLPADVEGSQGQTDRQKVDNELAHNLLGGFISFEQSLMDLGKSLGY